LRRSRTARRSSSSPTTGRGSQTDSVSDRDRDAAAARAHEAAVERAGGSDQRAEFETALEIRSGVVIGVPDNRNEE